MSDIQSGLPMRTQIPGQTNYDDVIIKMADGTTASQLAKVDTFGSQQSMLADAVGNIATIQANGSQWALDVGINVAGVQIDPRQIRALASGTDSVTAVQGTSPWITKDQSDGSVAPGTAAAFSGLAGAVYTSAGITLTNGQQAALQMTSTGALIVSASISNDTNYGVVGANTLRTAAQIGNATGAADFNFGAVGAQTLRAAAQIGNATGAADFNNGATSAQTLRVAANLAVGGANVSATNPVPVSFSSAPLGTPKNDYNTVAAVAAAASSNHDYAITAAKTFQGKKIWASASGLMKIEVQISPDGTTFSTLWVGFNSTAEPNITIDMDEMVFLESGTGSKIRVIRTNLDKKSMDVYSTISGTEVP